MGLRLCGSTVLLVSRFRGSTTVCLVSSAMVESTSGVAAVQLLYCSSGCAPVFSGLLTVFPIVVPAILPATLPATIVAATYPFRLPFQQFFWLLSTVTFPTYSPGISRQSVRTSRVSSRCSSQCAVAPLSKQKYL